MKKLFAVISMVAFMTAISAPAFASGDDKVKAKAKTEKKAECATAEKAACTTAEKKAACSSAEKKEAKAACASSCGGSKVAVADKEKK